MKIALIQTDIAWNDPAKNVEECTELAIQAVSQGAELLIFPEMFTCGFSLPEGELAQASAASGRSFLLSTAKKHTVFTVGSLPEVSAEGALFNTAYLYRPDGSFESYRKMHLFSYGDESPRYSPGDQTLSVEIGNLRCSIFICYDLRFPVPFHQLASKTDLFIVVANWPAARREHWLTLLKARAIENQAFVAGVNRVGEGNGLQYSGDSVLFAPDGSALTDLYSAQCAIVHELDLNQLLSLRERFPVLQDRRSDLYEKLS